MATTTSKAKITTLALQNGTDRTVYATWTWSKTNTSKYKVRWYYGTGNGVWFKADENEVTVKQSTYTAPANADRVRFTVKPISKTKKVNKKEVSYWTADWATYKTYEFSSNPPATPSIPIVTIDKYQLTVTLQNAPSGADEIEFEVIRDNKSKVNNSLDPKSKEYQALSAGFLSQRALEVYQQAAVPIRDVTRNTAVFVCTITSGHEYKARCRAIRNKKKSEWSDYSSPVQAMPSKVSTIQEIIATSATSVRLSWLESGTATSYDIEHTQNKSYFDSSNSTTVINSITTPNYTITGLETGQKYYFRVRAVNSQGASGWSSIKSITIGKKPSPPTTWSSTTTAIEGEEVMFSWTHNSEDNSRQTKAKLKLIINGETQIINITTTVNENEPISKIYTHVLDTQRYSDGTIVKWSICTAGITNEFSDWSVERVLHIYEPPTLNVDIADNYGNLTTLLTSFPMYVLTTHGPSSQTPIGYQVTILANESYETVDYIGNFKMVNEGEIVFSEYYDITDDLILRMSANHIDLENNIEYTVNCIVTTNVGLTAEAVSIFTVAWADEDIYEPNAELAYDERTLSMNIRPYCEDDNGILISGVSLAVYRIDYDGTFVEIAKDLANTKTTFVVDPHPSLDFARYRIVATDDDTGAVGYYDIPGYPTGESSVVIQWAEKWSNYDIDDTPDELDDPSWAGSTLKLPYNIDVSDDSSPAVEMVEYIGRRHPVSYYGTQVGASATWNVEIAKNDSNTLYALRRLMVWLGDVYVREPSGSGYWANIVVSFKQTHNEATIPVTLKLTRVEGGV